MAETRYSPPLDQRRAGVLLHISSLPGANAVGDLGGRRIASWISCMR